VIGVVATVRHNGLDVEPPRPQMYFAVAQEASSDVTVLVKTAVPPTDLIEPLREAILAVDPAQPIRDAQAFNDIIGESLGDRRLSLSLLTTFALIAVALALIGVYGVISYGVSRRTQEFGVRIALGGGDWHIFGLVISQVAKVALAGVGAGLLGAVVVSGLLSHQLFGVSRFDATTFMAVPLVIVACAMVACMLPARRAVRIAPMEALREE
jgi:ABC-type antimicrobial peptide transport system permease subunit